MKQKILLLIIALFLNPSLFAGTQCFLVQENNRVIKKEGDCESRHSPCSTFKIPISLMAYNEELLIDETHPEIPFKEGYTDFLDKWSNHTHLNFG